MIDQNALQQPAQTKTPIIGVLRHHNEELLKLWIGDRLKSGAFRDELISENELRQQSRQLLALLTTAIEVSYDKDFSHQAFDDLRQMLNEISRERAVKGYTPLENATYILSLRDAILPLLGEELKNDTATLLREVRYLTGLLDQMSLVMIENYIRSREQVITQQRADMMELSTPVIKVWDKILTLPIIGTLDSRRAQLMMEALLHKIVETSSTIAILDITGVRTMDTLVANHLIKTVTAARLMGARCILTGVSPAIAQTMVQLGIDLTQITTRAQMADGIRLALEMSGRAVVSAKELSNIMQSRNGGGRITGATDATSLLASQGANIVSDNADRARGKN